MSLAKATSQLGILFIFGVAVWFFGWELFMGDKETWELSVTKSEVEFIQGSYASKSLCEEASTTLPGEKTECQRMDGPHRVLNRILDVVFPFDD